jgi:hypothetical protein
MVNLVHLKRNRRRYFHVTGKFLASCREDGAESKLLWVSVSVAATRPHSHLRCGPGRDHHLLVPQAIDGVEVGRQACGIIAEEQAHTNGDRETNRHPQIRQSCGNRRHESVHQCGYSGPN